MLTISSSLYRWLFLLGAVSLVMLYGATPAKLPQATLVFAHKARVPVTLPLQAAALDGSIIELPFKGDKSIIAGALLPLLLKYLPLEDVVIRTSKAPNTYKMAQDALYPGLFQQIVQGRLDMAEFFPSKKQYELDKEYFWGQRDEYALLKHAIAQRMSGCLETCLSLIDWCKENHFYCMPATKHPEKIIANEKLLRQSTAAIFFQPALPGECYAIFDVPASNAITRANGSCRLNVCIAEEIETNYRESDDAFIPYYLENHLAKTVDKKFPFRYQFYGEGGTEGRGIRFKSNSETDTPLLIKQRWCVPCYADGVGMGTPYYNGYYSSRRIDMPQLPTDSDYVNRLQRFTDMLNLAIACDLNLPKRALSDLVRYHLLPFFAPTENGSITFSSSALLQALERELQTPAKRAKFFKKELAQRRTEYQTTHEQLVKNLQKSYVYGLLPDKKEACLRLLNNPTLATAAECDAHIAQLEEAQQIITPYEKVIDWDGHYTFDPITNEKYRPQENVGHLLAVKQRIIDLQEYTFRIRYLHASLATPITTLLTDKAISVQAITPVLLHPHIQQLVSEGEKHKQWQQTKAVIHAHRPLIAGALIATGITALLSLSTIALAFRKHYRSLRRRKKQTVATSSTAAS